MISKTNNEFIPNKAELRSVYHGYSPHFNVLISRLREFLGNIVELPTPPSFRERVKSFESYYRKLLRFPPSEAIEDLPVLTDIIGIRIVCSFLQDLTLVENILKENFKIVEIEKKGANRTFMEFGYESTHVLMEIPEEFKVGLKLPSKLIFEIQIRTILQDAWAEVEHELLYKAEFSPFDLPLKRKMASINASLSLADLIFQEIRDYQNKLNSQLDKRRTGFYSLADEYTSGIVDGQVPEHNDDEKSGVPKKQIYEPDSIDDLILSAITAHNQSEFEKAEKIYTKIIDKTDNNVVLSIVFKHRGMASFAQGRYQVAYEDFCKSVDYDDSNFRAYYYVGIALSMLNRNEEAIEYFTKSLEINSYQAHVHFRRALANYNESHFLEALRDLDLAVSLGYTKPNEKKLRIAISKKMDMI
ncbi:MAG: (p)ppGpp synthetase [Treponema sp.]|nr:MAG: (p)ppGpp synthetase [Treponema sp.]